MAKHKSSLKMISIEIILRENFSLFTIIDVNGNNVYNNIHNIRTKRSKPT